MPKLIKQGAKGLIWLLPNFGTQTLALIFTMNGYPGIQSRSGQNAFQVGTGRVPGGVYRGAGGFKSRGGAPKGGLWGPNGKTGPGQKITHAGGNSPTGYTTYGEISAASLGGA